MRGKITVFLGCFLALIHLYGQSRVTIEITSSLETKTLSSILITVEKDAFFEKFSNQLEKDLNNSGWLDIKSTAFKTKLNINSEMEGAFRENVRLLIVCGVKEKLEIEVYETFEKSLIFEFKTDIEKSPIDLAHTVCDEIIYRLTGKPGIAKSKILYMTRAKDIYTIMMADYDGSNATQIFSAEYIINYPRWFPSMDKVLFLSYRKTFPSLDLLDLKTRQIETFLAEPGLNACASFFRNQPMAAVVLSKSGNPDIYLVDLKGKIIRRITEKKGINASPSVSPDGQNIAFISDRDGNTRLWVVNPSGLNVKKVDIPSNYITSPCWSPDGKYLAYAVRYGTEMFIEIYDWNTGKRKLLTNGISWSDAPCWAPDSRHLIFTRQDKYQNSIWTIDIHNLKMKKIADNAWSGCWALR
ncbi:MAG: LpqB family beta-propeller domain-containing protein [Candidatus Omnitrophica bacterium]|nr:LpqB family beta-propeller domain-containing protein [Candidatus Omnitrophota bacterium]